eukprot:649820-Rhodomonas_salina.1
MDGHLVVFGGQNDAGSESPLAFCIRPALQQPRAPAAPSTCCSCLRRPPPCADARELRGRQVCSAMCLHTTSRAARGRTWTACRAARLRRETSLRSAQREGLCLCSGATLASAARAVTFFAQVLLLSSRSLAPAAAPAAAAAS